MTPREEAERQLTRGLNALRLEVDGSIVDALAKLAAAALTACREERDGEIATLRSQVERLQEKSAYLRDDNTRLEQERDLARQDSQRLREVLERFVRIMTWADTQKSWLQLEDKLLVSELSRCRYDAEIVLTSREKKDAN